MTAEYRYAYLHGFASSAASYKGVELQKRFREWGLELELPDLNLPSFAELSHAAMLAGLDAMDIEARSEGRQWRLIGSSLGGWLAARWAELNPARVERLLLLCPGFDLAERWPTVLGQARFEAWERDGALALPDGHGVEVPVHFGFVEEARRHPGRPAVPCPTLIVHGRGDATVPIASSRAYAAASELVTLVEVDDGHGLSRSVDHIAAEAQRHWAVWGATTLF